jgi:CheY-like chemotaxis protein
MAPDIVIIDSERATRRHLELALAPWGYTIGGFSDARTALKELTVDPPRLVLSELLLPGLDGFELFQGVRSAVGDRVQLMCITAVSWGRLSLGELMRKRFGARCLRKPFLKSEILEQIHGLIGPGKHGAGALANEWRIGVAEARRVEDLAREFETRLIRVGGEYGRRTIRAHAHHPVKWKALGDWVQSQAGNIAAGGGMFIEHETPPRLDEIIELSVELPPRGRHLRARARVANRIPPAEAAAAGSIPGFGVEMLELTDEDRHLLDTLVRDLRAGERAGAGAEPEGEARGATQTWLLLVGLDGAELLKRPGFLHRGDIELMSVPDADAAATFLASRQTAVCVVRESALGADARKALGRIAEVTGEGTQIIVIGNTGLSSLIAQGVCDSVLRPDTTMEMLIEELRERLGVPRRGGPRIPFRGGVALAAGGQEISGTIVNISTGGMLLRSAVALPVGSDVDVRFDLPDAPAVIARGRIVRSKLDRTSSEIFSAVSFADLDEDTASALSRFVQSQVNFRDYFAWLKTAYFSGRLDW